ncbi:15-hydroxyprostaglandin dehydrogenase [Fusarium pseudocircinatum]|uniref:15-hydroxyprostaglandin dehydrogenase n=1 Tax=Fusarium pseudocircinatum TaxID=56676 RepID=A0A8H5UPE8_9HYPO|nr:15-hydroxyprostaglandin dehydrogenase [Fusarium pseudocircinatum]
MIDSTKRYIALVTGGGSGISLAFVKKIHEIGYHVLIADLALHPTASTWIDSLQPSDADRVKFFKLDVTDWAQLEAAFDHCETVFNGVPTVVVPGAGVYEPSSNSFWEDRDKDSRYKVLDINLVHPIKTTRIAVRRLVEAGLPGTVIHLSSIAAQRSSIITPLYTASKHALSSFVRGMAPLAQTSGIRVLGVAPGTVSTPLFSEKPEAAKFLDMERDYLLPPDAVANAMIALLTQTEEFEPGTMLEVCHETEWRKVSLLDDPGPQGPASLTSKKKDAVKDIYKYLAPGKASADSITTD